jgi:hypothetical protein
MTPELCPSCRRPRAPGNAFCTRCHYFLGQPSLQPVIGRRQAAVTTDLFLILLLGAALMAVVGVLLSVPAA